MDDYYNLTDNMVYIRGYKEPTKIERAKFLKYPGILDVFYCITPEGRIYANSEDNYINWSIKNGKPFVNLIFMRGDESGTSLEPFFIKDLMAYNYINDSEGYISDGCNAVNVDGDPMNCRYDNILYLDPKKEYC